MTAEQLLSDVLHGNFSNAYARLADWYSGWPVWLKVFASKLATDEGIILQGLVNVAATDVKTNGLNTDSFINAGKDVLAKLEAQNISTFTLQEVISAINMAVAAS